MVRRYIRKTSRAVIRQDVLDQAKTELELGNSIRSVAAKFSMDESTLTKRLKKVCWYSLTYNGRILQQIYLHFTNKQPTLPISYEPIRLAKSTLWRFVEKVSLLQIGFTCLHCHLSEIIGICLLLHGLRICVQCVYRAWWHPVEDVSNRSLTKLGNLN